MLIHPSQRQHDHKRYLEWIQEAIKRWTSSLRSTERTEKDEVIEEFRPAYSELLRTDERLPPFEDLLQRLHVALSRVSLQEVNSQDGSEIDWENADDHILVGGEKLNRGFTMKGLTVTYMPRDSGGWNADTLQQRARFFGYRSGYLSLCRLYLHPEVIQAFKSYIRHEEDIRKQLFEHRGKPLREWRRAFFLNSGLRPTRRNVLSDPYYRTSVHRAWFVQRRPHADLQASKRNEALLDSFSRGLTFVADRKYFKHKVCEVHLAQFFRDVLIEFEAREGDVPGWYAQLVFLRDILDDAPNARMLLVKMSGPRQRTIDKDGVISPQQGPSAGKEMNQYPGDSKLSHSTIVTVQWHMITVKERDWPQVLALAIYIPASLRKDDVISQG